MNEEQDFWNNTASQDPYLAVWGGPGYAIGVKDCLNQVRPFIPESGNVMDIGCGVGRILLPLSRQFPQTSFFGVDISSEMLSEAKRQRDTKNVSLLLTDGIIIPPTPPMQMIYSMLTFQHMRSDAVIEYIHQISEGLTSGGIFRFQYVVGTDDGPYNHQLANGTMEKWCERSGLIIETSDLGIIYPEWKWVTAVKS